MRKSRLERKLQEIELRIAAIEGLKDSYVGRYRVPQYTGGDKENRLFVDYRSVTLQEIISALINNVGLEYFSGTPAKIKKPDCAESDDL